MSRMPSRVTPPEASSFNGLAAARLSATASTILREREIIQHRDVGAGRDRLPQFVEALDLDLHRHRGTARAGCRHRAGDGSRGHDVIFLDQNAVVEADPVILPAADPHRVLLRGAQAGDGLAGVEQAARRALQALHMGMGGGRGARQQLQEVERGALTGQKRPGRALDLEQDLAGLRRRRPRRSAIRSAPRGRCARKCRRRTECRK